MLLAAAVQVQVPRGEGCRVARGRDRAQECGLVSIRTLVRTCRNRKFWSGGHGGTRTSADLMTAAGSALVASMAFPATGWAGEELGAESRFHGAAVRLHSGQLF
jgi:hypothetical protein